MAKITTDMILDSLSSHSLSTTISVKLRSFVNPATLTNRTSLILLSTLAWHPSGAIKRHGIGLGVSENLNLASPNLLPCVPRVFLDIFYSRARATSNMPMPAKKLISSSFKVFDLTAAGQ